MKKVFKSLLYKKMIYYEMSFTEKGETLKYAESIAANEWNSYWWWHQLKDQTLLWAKEMFLPNKVGKLLGAKKIEGKSLSIEIYNR